MMAVAEIQVDAAAMQGLEDDAAPLVVIEGSAVRCLARALDDTTEQYGNFAFSVPQDVDAGGTVTFRVACVPAVAAAGKNVAHTLGFRAVAAGEDFDGSYTDVGSGDQAVEETQDEVSIHAWTETVANLGWSAGDVMLARYSRPQASADNLPDDLCVIHVTIEIPVG